jgi:hypothetical protein
MEAGPIDGAPHAVGDPYHRVWPAGVAPQGFAPGLTSGGRGVRRLRRHRSRRRSDGQGSIGAIVARWRFASSPSTGGRFTQSWRVRADLHGLVARPVRRPLIRVTNGTRWTTPLGAVPVKSSRPRLHRVLTIDRPVPPSAGPTLRPWHNCARSELTWPTADDEAAACGAALGDGAGSFRGGLP